MKICYIANASSINTRLWIGPLIQAGMDVHLLSYQPLTQPWPEFRALVDLTQMTNRRKLRFVQWAGWIRNYVRRTQPDILHAHQLQAAGWLASLAGYHPFVASAWGSDLLVEPHRSALRRLLLRYVLNRCDRLTVPAPALAGAAAALGIDRARLRLIPWGIETAIFRPEPSDHIQTRVRLDLPLDAALILCPRAIAPIYNTDILVRAFAQLGGRFPHLRLVLLEFNMDEPYRQALQATIRRQALADRVVWLPPRTSREEMAQLYRAVDVTVSIPSSDGYSASVLEAMACGCPTVISDLPSYTPTLVDGRQVLKVPVRSVAHTAQAIAGLLQHGDLRRTLSRQGQTQAAGHTVAGFVAQTQAMYSEFAP